MTIITTFLGILHHPSVLSKGLQRKFQMAFYPEYSFSYCEEKNIHKGNILNSDCKSDYL